MQLMRKPVLNNGLFAIRADAPHWALWQKHFEMMVRKTRRTIAIDQLALISMIHIKKQPCANLPATDNWVCSLATPWWDPKRALFVRPGELDKPVSVMHLTTPSRERMFDVYLPDGQTERRYLCRPDGRVMTAMKRAAQGRPDIIVAEPSIGGKHARSRLLHTVSR